MRLGWRACFGNWTAVAALAATVGFTAPAAAPSSPAAALPLVNIFPTAQSHLGSPKGPVTTTQCEQMFQIACYLPGQIEAAYDEAPLFAKGIEGQGQSIAIIDAFGSPTIRSDLATFDKTFGLAKADLQIIEPAGKVPKFNGSNPTMVAWAGETTLDVEWAHAMAPRARLVLVETPVAETEGVSGFAQIVRAENYVVDHRLASVISQSFSATEQTLPSLVELAPLRASFINAYEHGVTVLAAAGDQGATEASNILETLLFDHPVTTWPPSDPLVTGIGGTQLHLNTAGARTAPDNVWNDGSNSHLDELFFNNSGPDALASGGGVSTLFSRPAFQQADSSVVGSKRGVPDVSMSAACDGSVDVYESFPGIGRGWYLSCGTSEAVPLFAGIVALADQVAGHPLGLINPALYQLAAEHAPGIVDITSGNNTVSFRQNGTLVTVQGYRAGPGYDLASGVGTVDAAKFVPELAELENHSGSGPGCHGSDCKSVKS